MCVLTEAGNHSSLIHTRGSSSSTHSWSLLTLHFSGVLLLPWAGAVYKDSAVQRGWHSQGPGRTRCPGRVSSARSGQEVQIQVCVEKGNTGVCSSWSNPAPCRKFPLLYTGERSTGNQVLDPTLMKRIYFPLSQSWAVSKVQKGRQCYVWEGQHSQCRIWCNGNYPRLFLLACSKTSSQLLHSCVNPLVYPHGVSWTISELQGLGAA